MSTDTGRTLKDCLGDFEKLLLLPAILLEDLIQIDIFGITAFNLCCLCLDLLLTLAGLFGSFLGLDEGQVSY